MNRNIPVVRLSEEDQEIDTLLYTNIYKCVEAHMNKNNLVDEKIATKICHQKEMLIIYLGVVPFPLLPEDGLF